MGKNVELIITDSYFKVFDILTDRLARKTEGVKEKNVIFCEEKISLMAERAICDRFGGTFNTDVYSFINYLKSRKRVDALSREGSAMAVKRILADVPLSALKAGKINLAPTLFNLIIQLKSASVSPEDLNSALPFLPDFKREKIKDIAAIYAAYENFIKENGFIDQSSVMNFLPEEIEKDESLSGARVFLIGYDSWTEQARRAILSLIRVADEVIAVVAGGENRFLFVNETAEFFSKICKKAGANHKESFVSSYETEETRLLSKKLFNPLAKKTAKISTDRVFLNRAENPEKEIYAIAGIIAKNVKNGKRYFDHTVALPDVKAYGKYVKYYFDLMGVPCFIDEKITPSTYPLVRLILSYFDIFRKNYDRTAVISFFKNPLYSEDKETADFMENYFIRYNVNYDAVLKPFVFGEEFDRAESFRKSLLPFIEKFDIEGMLSALDVKSKTERLSAMLKERGESVAAEVNLQTYDAVIKILHDMERILSGADLSITERKNVFLSGVLSTELSVIPQFYDAVYVGDYRKTALAKAEILFAPALTSDVPAVKDDVALISDDDIELLKVKADIDPTVRIVNLRAKENFGVALLAFKNKLYLSYPEVDGGGKKTSPSDALKYFVNALNIAPYSFKERYISQKQAILNFAEDVEAYSEKLLAEIPLAAAFYAVSASPVKDDVLKAVRKQIKIRLEGVKRDIFAATSPTKIEDYYKCPYRAFVRRVLKIGDADDGKISALSVGNLMHAIFKEYFADVGSVKDRQGSDALFKKAAGKTLEIPEYKKFLADRETEELLLRVLKEAENYCYKCFLNLDKTLFKPDRLEQKVSYVLPESKIKLTGNVDRVDKFTDGTDEYVRIIDYKTGKIDEDDNLLYAGVKLQLYLYAAAFKDGKTKISGLYYAPIKEEYCEEDKKNGFIAFGKTLKDEKSLAAQRAEDGAPAFSDDIKSAKGKKEKTFSEEIINACVDYAVKICDAAVKNMKDGVIIASPYAGECQYCNLKAMCRTPFGENGRKVSGVSCEKIAGIDFGENDG